MRHHPREIACRCIVVARTRLSPGRTPGGARLRLRSRAPTVASEHDESTHGRRFKLTTATSEPEDPGSQLVTEIQRYLRAVDAFRAEGCAPCWREQPTYCETVPES